MLYKDIQYDFKKKLDKIDSEQYRNLLIPEIDWVINEAKEIFIKNQINQNSLLTSGIGVNTRNIRTLVTGVEITPVNNIVELPEDFFYFLKAEVEITKGACLNKKARVYIKQYDDEFEESPFDKSSFEWRQVNGVFNENGLQLFTDGTFSIDSVQFTYIRKSVYCHNAEDFNSNGYNLPSGELLTGVVECDLPDYTHREIIDLAVLITTGELQIPDYQIKLNKIKLIN